MTGDNRTYEVEIQDYEPGEDEEPGPPSASVLEGIIEDWLNRTGGDGIVIVRELAA